MNFVEIVQDQKRNLWDLIVDFFGYLLFFMAENRIEQFLETHHIFMVAFVIIFILFSGKYSLLIILPYSLKQIV